MYKLLISFFLIVTFLITTQKLAIAAEQEAKIAVIINHASWCPACQSNGERVKMNVVSKYMESKNVKILVNDLSNEETILNSQKELNKLGLNEFSKTNKSTGTIYFVDLKTKKVITNTNVTKSNEELIKFFDKNLKN